MGELQPQDPNEGSRKKRNTIGEDFVIWAEEYWRLKEVYSGTETALSETNDYKVLSKAFSEAIDRFIEVRLRDADILR